ncbi:TPA: hypothetical protein ACQRM7_000703 [Pseudomonas aeruginosa]
MNDYKSAFNAAAADISAIIALLGFTKYPGVDPVLRAIADLILEKAESQVLREERDAANKRADTLEHRMMGMMTRHFAEAWHNRDTQKALDGYLSAGIAQLEQAEQAEAERPELWAVHAQGPDELYAAFTREDAEKHAAELNALPMPEGIAVGAVVVPSPWPEAEHWKYLAEQEQDHKNEIAGRLRQLERICEGLPQDAIDGGWTAQGIRGYAKRLEDQLKAALAQVKALRAELQSQRERNTELIFKLGSATNGWGRCEKERDAALARVAELERQQPVAWMHDQPNRVDVIHRDVKDLLQRVPGSSRGIHRPLDVSEHYTIPLYAAPVAQAQHSVPEISGIGRDAEHPRAVVLYLRNEPSEEDMRAIQNFLRAISADVLTQAQHSAGYAEARMCANCRHIGINDAADYAACHDCNWTGPEPDEDKCPGCAGENCMAAACPECGCRYDLVAEANITAPAGQVPQAWLDVQAERRRQITAEGWTPEHDDEHDNGEMARAAACYALAGSSAPSDGTAALLVSLAWPWDEQWWKPSTARRDMVKACALALAEIERLDRACISQSPQPGATTASS